VQYLGGKTRLAGPISKILLERLNGRLFVEPFRGALNITAAMEPAGRRIASDINPYLFTLYKSLRAGWEPPKHVTEDDYRRVRAVNDERDPLIAFVGYGCSFGGKWWGGYARPNKTNRNYCDTARRGILKKLRRCQGVAFASCAFTDLDIDSRCLVYCDPPYAGTTEYSAARGFDSDEFWGCVRSWSQAGAIVLVSEYAAPPDFESIWTAPVHGGQLAKSSNREHLFQRKN